MIAAGFGFRRGARVDSLLDALELAMHDKPVDILATSRDKAVEPVFLNLAATVGITVKAVGADIIKAQDTPTQSEASLAAQGTGSLAEAAALGAIGQGARLLGARVISPDGMATCALAERKEA